MAVRSVRDVFAGGSAKAISAFGNYLPRVVDKLMEWTMFGAQKTDRPERNREAHGLYRPAGKLEERGGYEGPVAESSLYSKASLHPMTTAALAAGAGLAIVPLLRPVLIRKPRRGISRFWR